MANLNERAVTLVSSGIAWQGENHVITPRGERLRIIDAKYEIAADEAPIGRVTVTMYGKVGVDPGHTWEPCVPYGAWREEGNPCPTCGSTAHLALQKADSELCTPRRHLCLACLTDNDVVTKLDAVTP